MVSGGGQDKRLQPVALALWARLDPRACSPSFDEIEVSIQQCMKVCQGRQGETREKTREKGTDKRKKGQGTMSLARVQGARSPLLGLGSEPTCASGAYCVGERVNRNKWRPEGDAAPIEVAEQSPNVT